MNCLEFRRYLLADPRQRSRTWLRHQRDCPGCAREARRIQALDARLSQTLQVDPPEGLISRVLLIQSFRQAAPSPIGWLARLAAGLVLGLGVIWAAWHWLPPSLETTLLARMETGLEPSRQGRVSAVELRRVLASLDLGLHGEAGPVQYARTTWIRGHRAAHLVLAGRQGPVTVFILPDESDMAFRVVETPRYVGYFLPLERGGMVILGAPGEPLQPIAERLGRNLVWP